MRGLGLAVAGILGSCVSASPADDTASLAAPVCPPPGPYGIGVGDYAEDVQVTDCAGGSVSLHGLCGRPALLVNWYGWCPSCEDNAALARSLAEAHADLAVAVVLDEDPLGEPVDAPLCDQYAEAYPSPAQVWMDPGGVLERYGTTDLVVVLDAAGRLTFVRTTATADAITEAVAEVLTRH